MPNLSKRIKVMWIEEKGLHVLLVILALQIFLIFPFFSEFRIFRFILAVFYGALLYVGLAQYTRAKKSAMIWIVAGVIFCLVVIAEFARKKWTEVANDAVFILYCLALAYIVLVRTLSAGPVNLYRIEGSIVAFLLIGLVFCFLHDMIFMISGPGAYKGLGTGDKKEFMYFSLVTLTTVGYGDITPAIPVSRSMANLEALIGQLYPAILIARLVSKEISSSNG
jgi:hypothetical protein